MRVNYPLDYLQCTVSTLTLVAIFNAICLFTYASFALLCGLSRWTALTQVHTQALVMLFLCSTRTGRDYLFRTNSRLEHVLVNGVSLRDVDPELSRTISRLPRSVSV